MMPRKPVANESAEDKAVRELEAEDDAALAHLAAQAPPPADADRLSEADEDTAWETTDPLVDYEAMAKQLTTQGLPPEIAQRLLIGKLRPDWLPLYGQPTQDAEQAHVLARAAEYPFRLSLLEDADDPEEMVSKAERLDRRFQKRHTQRQEQAAAMPIRMGMPQSGAAGVEPAMSPPDSPGASPVGLDAALPMNRTPAPPMMGG